MAIKTNSFLEGATLKTFRFLFACLLLPIFACAQEKQSQSEKPADGVDRSNVPDAIAKVRSGEFSGVQVDLIARANAVEAIPVLKGQFGRVTDENWPLKAKIAATLVRLGDKDGVYWNYLVNLAEPALESNAPDFVSYDSKGKTVPGPAPEFDAWVKSHQLSPDGLGEDSVYILPGKVMFLGWSRDSRAIPLLRQALLSPNHMIEIAAASGLAEIGDKDSIPLIIDACKKAPADVAAAMGESLVYFDDLTAQNAVDAYVPRENAKIYRDAKAQGKKRPWE